MRPNTPLGLSQQLGLLAVLLLTSKDAAGVAGAAFVVLAATLSTVGQIPVASVALILGVHRLMSEPPPFHNGTRRLRAVPRFGTRSTNSARMYDTVALGHVGPICALLNRRDSLSGPMTNDTEFLEQLAVLRRGYLVDCRADAATMRACVADGRFDDVRRLAHRMRGTGATYGFGDLTTLGAELESAASASDVGRLLALLDDLDRSLAAAADGAAKKGTS